jgi:hypothetical protein
MFKFLKSLLSRGKIESQNKIVPLEDNDCSLEIQMNKDGTLNIVCSWPEFDVENKDTITSIASHYALMIDAINQGFLSKQIISTIKNYKGHNAYDTLFAQNVFYKIAELNYLKEKMTEESPAVIRPSQVFKNLSQY